MNDDFEEEYDDYDDESDFLEDAKETYDDIKDLKDKYDKYKNKGKESNSSNPQQEARNFDNQLKEKNMARSQNPQAAQQVGNEAGKKAATQAGSQVATTGASTGGATAAGGAATAGTATAAGGAATAGTAAAAGGAATAGTAAAAGGAVAAQAAIPVAGWIALAVEAVIALAIAAKKALKKHDEKMAENGVDSKGLRKLLKASPIILPIAIIILIIIILVQSETQEKVDFLNQAVKCFESDQTCTDFMNTRISITATGNDVINATDLQIANFVVQYVTAENKYYGSNGSSFMSDIVNDLNTVAKEGLVDDSSVFDKIVDWFEELIENSIIGDINYAWNLFKWMKMEKKVFNNIDWYKTYADTLTGYGTLDKITEWAKYTILDDEPKIGFADTETRTPLEFGSLSLTEAYLSKPLDVDVDFCIEAVRPYIPSWIELYATYVATGDYNLTNDIYDYYVDKDTYKLEVTVYELFTVKKTKKVKSSVEPDTKYYVNRGKGAGYQLSSKEEVDQLKSEGEKSFWSWLGDALANFVEKAEQVLQKVVDEIDRILFSVNVSQDYTIIVTEGNAYKYKTNQKYTIYTEKPTVETKEKAESRKASNFETIKYTEKVENSDGKEEEKEYTATFKVESTAYIDHIITTWINKLKYVSTDISEYDQDNRYLQIFIDMVEKNDYNYTIDDVANAAEIIESFYGETYMSTGSSIDYSALPEGDFGWPVPSNKIVSALFGYTNWYGSNHGGIDIWAVDNAGNPSASFSLVKKIDIVAAQKGKVVIAYDGGCADGNKVSQSCGGGYGNYVKIQHDNNYVTIYGHLSPGTIAVSVGQEVTAGQYLGKMGSSGNSSGTHLHYEIQFDGNRIDPLVFYDVEPYNYKVPYAQRNNSAITMANPYKVNFSL